MADAILVTRPEPGASDTAARLAALGFAAVLAPALTIAPRRLTVAALPQAVLVTSGNAIAALPDSLLTIPLLAVGDATAAKARQSGFATVHSAGRDAAALAALAVALLHPGAGTLLLASGEGQGMALAATLRGHGFTVRRRLAYAAAPAGGLPAAAQTALTTGTVRSALFFSPHSARTFMAILQRDMPTADVRGIEALAISSPTEAVLRAWPWRRVRVASHPNQEGLLKLLQ